jgi:hypothetical protein
VWFCPDEKDAYGFGYAKNTVPEGELSLHAY